MADYLRRALDDDLDELMREAPAIAIVGAKGVGKTAMLTRRAASKFSLDIPSDRHLVAGNPTLIATADPPCLLDEWQYVPDTWNVVKRAVDDGAAPGSFLIAGSASPHGEARVHSGAGRILSLTMRPLALAERYPGSATISLADLLRDNSCKIDDTTTLAVQDYAAEVINSGLPGLRNRTGRLHTQYVNGYLDLIVDRDVPESGLSLRNPDVMLAWLRSYAAAVSTTTDYKTILDASTPGEPNKPTKKTTIAYRNALRKIHILEPLPAWLPNTNHLTRLRQSPKHHLVDPALAARLLGLTPANVLRSTHLGPLFESLACLSVRVAATRANASVFHLRTYNGEQEVDMIVEGEDGAVAAFEVKLADHVSDDDVAHLKWLRQKIGDTLVNAAVLYTGARAYRRSDGVAVIPLALLGS